MKQPEKYFIVTQKEVNDDALAWGDISSNTDKEIPDYCPSEGGGAVYIYKLHTILKSRTHIPEEDDSPTIIYKD